MNPAIHQTMVGVLLGEASQRTPEQFRASFCGGVIANVVGNLPDDYWREFCRITVCDQPGCNCHELHEKTIAALDALRDDHKANTKKS